MHARIDDLKESITEARRGMENRMEGFPSEFAQKGDMLVTAATLKELKDKEGSFVGVSPLETLRALTRISGPGVSLSEISIEKDIIILKGECPSLSDTQKIKSELEDILTSVSISDTKPSSGNKTLFTITAKGVKA